jgi:hypothetical protein
VHWSRRPTRCWRRYLLYRGPVGAVTNFWFEPNPVRESPAFWWPEDRAWFVSTEIDAQSTYVAGPGELIERLLATEGLEVHPATLDDPFDGIHVRQAMQW